MDLAMEEKPALIFAGSSSSLTTADDDISWDEWSSPELCWSNEYLDSLIIASNKSEHSPFSTDAGNPFPAAVPHIIQECSFNSSDGNKGERLVHLLMAAAEALSGDHSKRDLARVILVRLKELNGGASSSIERLAAHFTHGLHALLDGGNTSAGEVPFCQYPAGEVLTAFHMLQDMSPFASFGHLTANQAILEAFTGERRVHIIDYDIAEGVQWASLIQAMASRKETAPPPHLKITALSNGSYRSASVAQEAGRRLSAFAETVGQPFTFRMCRLDQRKKFMPAAVKVVRGEPVVVNCVLHPAQVGHGNGSSASVVSFLAGAPALGARLVTVVEEEGDNATGDEKRSFFGRFVNELERYMAVWESLEAGFPKQGRVRRMVERVLLGPRIAEALRAAYGRSNCNGLEAPVEGCGRWMEAAGFEKVGLSFFNRSQARLLLGLFNDGYRVEEVASNKLVLCWKSCQLLSASVWAIPTLRPASPSSSPPFGSIFL